MSLYSAVKTLDWAIESGWLANDARQDRLKELKDELNEVRKGIPGSSALSEENIQKLLAIKKRIHIPLFERLFWKRFEFNKPRNVYVRALSSVSNEIDELLAINEKLNKLPSSKEYPILAIEYDLLYQKTREQYHGVLLAPINQGLDLNTSSGHCYGYVAQWAKGFIDGGKPFGIDPKSSEQSQVLLYSSPHGRKNLRHNHRVPTNDRIAELQDSQGNQEGEFPQALSDDRSIKFHREKEIFYFHKSSDISDNLIQLAERDPAKVYNLSIGKADLGHSFGFKKDAQSGEYHFFDANAGWFKFKKHEDFKRWFDDYFATMGYAKIFHEYRISSFGREDKNEAVLSAFQDRRSTFGTMTYNFFRKYYYQAADLLANLNAVVDSHIEDIDARYKESSYRKIYQRHLGVPEKSSDNRPVVAESKYGEHQVADDPLDEYHQLDDNYNPNDEEAEALSCGRQTSTRKP